MTIKEGHHDFELSFISLLKWQLSLTSSCSHSRSTGTDAQFFISPTSVLPPKKWQADSNSAGPAYLKTALLFFGGSVGVWA